MSRQKGFSAVEGLVFVAIAGVIGFGGWYVLNKQSEPADQATGQNMPQPLSKAEMREEFRCDRVTADSLATDVYCSDYSWYVEDFKNSIVLGSQDFNEHHKSLQSRLVSRRDTPEGWTTITQEGATVSYPASWDEIEGYGKVAVTKYSDSTTVLDVGNGLSLMYGHADEHDGDAWLYVDTASGNVLDTTQPNSGVSVEGNRPTTVVSGSIGEECDITSIGFLVGADSYKVSLPLDCVTADGSVGVGQDEVAEVIDTMIRLIRVEE